MEALAALDVRALAWVLSLPHPAWLDWLMTAVSVVGRWAAVWLVLGAVFAGLGRLSWMAYWQLVLAVCLVFLTVEVVLKPSVGRERPSRAHVELGAVVEPPASASFPSGHAATASAGAYTLSRFLPRARAGLWLLAGLIALARVYLGGHYPLDVAAGALLGLGCAMFSVGGTVWYSRDPAVRVSQVPR